jgi:hypothetical protein
MPDKLLLIQDRSDGRTPRLIYCVLFRQVAATAPGPMAMNSVLSTRIEKSHSEEIPGNPPNPINEGNPSTPFQPLNRPHLIQR